MCCNVISLTCTAWPCLATAALPHLCIAATPHTEGESRHVRPAHRQHAGRPHLCVLHSAHARFLLLLCCSCRCERDPPAMEAPAKRSHHADKVSSGVPQRAPRGDGSAWPPLSRAAVLMCCVLLSSAILPAECVPWRRLHECNPAQPHPSAQLLLPHMQTRPPSFIFSPSSTAERASSCFCHVHVRTPVGLHRPADDR